VRILHVLINQDSQLWCRIDRFLLSLDWEEQFPNISKRRLPRNRSDHFPLLLDCGGSDRGNRYYKFENMWMKSEGFVEQVKTWWMSYRFQGSPSFVLARKLKALKSDLKKCNEEFSVM
jgi:hypothetical protein